MMACFVDFVVVSWHLALPLAHLFSESAPMTETEAPQEPLDN